MTLDTLRAETGTPVVMVNQAGLVTHVNDAFLRAFGWTRERVESQPLSTLIPPRLHDAHNLGFSRFLVTGVPTLLGRPLRLWVRGGDGHERPAELTLHAAQEGGAWTFGATARPLEAA